MTVTIGTWAIPLVITLIAFALAHVDAARDPSSGGFLGGLVYVFNYGFALILSLVAWLIWSLVS